MKRFLSSVLLLAAILSPPAEAIAEHKQVVGLVETVRVLPGDLIMDAKLDTGADNSSIHATGIVEFTREGAPWVRFRAVSRKGKGAVLERELVRVARIKATKGKSRKRPVVMLSVCLGKTHREVQVTLVNRSRFRYRMILGRSFLRDRFIIDSSLKHTVQPECPDLKAD
jgi:hypothetical protein